MGRSHYMTGGLGEESLYPHSIRLADGEPLESIHSLLHLRAPYQVLFYGVHYFIFSIFFYISVIL